MKCEEHKCTVCNGDRKLYNSITKSYRPCYSCYGDGTISGTIGDQNSYYRELKTQAKLIIDAINNCKFKRRDAAKLLGISFLELTNRINTLEKVGICRTTWSGNYKIIKQI